MSVKDGIRVIGGSRRDTTRLMEQVVSRENMKLAYKRVVGNAGSAGIDGMPVEELEPFLRKEWERIKAELLGGTYRPSPVKSVMIDKPGGGERELGIPTVLDRLLQQALHQVLSPLYEPEFSNYSYGFRPFRNAQQAVEQSQQYIREGRRWVVDIDLSKFFDEVHQDRLLGKLRKRVLDRRVTHLIDRYLRAGIMRDGIEEVREKGTPQGSPLSPLLSNIVLDELDKELESRGLKFVRYADDFQIYVKTERSAERVKTNTTKFIERQLRLKVNEEKSAIGRPWHRDFLGYSFTSDKQAKLKPSKRSLKRLRKKIKKKLREGKGRNLTKFIRKDLNPILRGWINHFRCSNTRRFVQDLNSWIRRCLRKIKWQQWKRRWTRVQELMRRGLGEEHAVRSVFNQRGSWWNAGAPHMNLAFPKKYFDDLGLIDLEHQLNRRSR